MTDPKTIRIRIQDPAGGERRVVEVPADVEISSLLPALVERLHHPVIGESGHPIEYRLVLRDRPLVPSQTLTAAGVKEDDLVTLMQEAVAGCFPAGTRIILADHTECPIEDIRPGDRVLSYDAEHRQTSAATVERIFTGSSDRCLVINDLLRVTESHLVYVGGQWRAARQIRPGDVLMGRAGRTMIVADVRPQMLGGRVYNLHLSSWNHTFFAEGILVHNADRKFAYAVEPISPRGGNMPMGKHTLQVDINALLDVFKRGLFSDPRVAVRELLFNAYDACVLRQAQDPTFSEPRIDVSTNAVSRTIAFADNGAGMSAQELRDHLSTIGGSSKRLLQKSGVDKPLSLFGGFGIGSLAAASIADKVEVFTRSWWSGPGLKWTYTGSSEYSIEEVPKEDVGTRVLLHLREEHLGFLDTTTLAGILRRFVPAITTPVYLDGSLISGAGPRGTTPKRSTTPDRSFLYTVKPFTPRSLRLVAITPLPHRGFDPEDADTPKEAPELDVPLGVMRIDIQGLWSVRDFTGMLQTFENAYTQFGAVYRMAQHLSRTEIAVILHEVSLNSQNTSSDSGEELVRATTQGLRALRISQIRLASPGFVEFIGTLNPLKLVADFIIRWREQNFADKKSAREAEIERLKINADVAKATFAGLVGHVRQKVPLNEVIAGVLHSVHQTEESMTETARDVRLVRVSVKEIDVDHPGDVEPSPAQPDSGGQT